jgi:glucose/arabinose dehydrogenase
MLPVRQRPGIKTRKHALGSGAALTALLLAASCTPAPTEGSGGNTGTGGSQTSSGGSGGKPAGNAGSGGTSSTGSGGTSSTGSGGTSSTGSGGTSSTGSGGTSSTGTGGTTAGGTGGAMGGEPDAGGGNPSSDWPTPCSTEPAATVPALKATPIAKLPGGDGAGQVFGVPGEKGIYVLGHRTGKVYYVLDGKVDPTPMAQVTIVNNAPQDEQGLLGVALHPNFKQNQLFYLFYTTPAMHVQELKRTGMTSSMPTKTIWDKPRADGGKTKYHNGGQISFSVKDNGKPLLYHSLGNNSTAGADTPEGTVGRILIHDIEAGTATTLAYGLRNPYRLHIDRLTGDMYVGETNGPAGGTIRYSPFANPVKDFGFPKGGNQGATVPSPFAGIEGSKALIGGVVYRGNKIPAICGRYFYAGWDEGTLRSLVVKDGKAVKANVGVTVGDISSFGEDGEGEIYMSSQGGEIFKLEAN